MTRGGNDDSGTQNTRRLEHPRGLEPGDSRRGRAGARPGLPRRIGPSWHGFDRLDFVMDEQTLAIKPLEAATDDKPAGDGRPRCILVVPKKAGSGQPVVLARPPPGSSAAGRGRAAGEGVPSGLHHARAAPAAGGLARVPDREASAVPQAGLRRHERGRRAPGRDRQGLHHARRRQDARPRPVLRPQPGARRRRRADRHRRRGPGHLHQRAPGGGLQGAVRDLAPRAQLLAHPLGPGPRLWRLLRGADHPGPSRPR